MQVEPYPNHSNVMTRLIAAGLTTGIIDGLFSSVAVVMYGSTIPRLFQGVASTLVGTSAFTGGARTAAVGILMHFGVAFAWSAVFIFGLMRLARIRAILASGHGVVMVAAVYGPLIWLVMSLVVIPILLAQPPNITFRWWVQFFGHFLFVGLPIVALGSRDSTRTASATATN